MPKGRSPWMCRLCTFWLSTVPSLPSLTLLPKSKNNLSDGRVWLLTPSIYNMVIMILVDVLSQFEMKDAPLVTNRSWRIYIKESTDDYFYDNKRAKLLWPPITPSKQGFFYLMAKHITPLLQILHCSGLVLCYIKDEPFPEAAKHFPEVNLILGQLTWHSWRCLEILWRQFSTCSILWKMLFNL